MANIIVIIGEAHLFYLGLSTNDDPKYFKKAHLFNIWLRPWSIIIIVAQLCNV